ncbi:hypothetical protein HK102_012021 [Quaeritorhiza haematococci]|nr:hypothetical protein HK102_012021 [Quaeritorhiza haematococci]
MIKKIDEIFELFADSNRMHVFSQTFRWEQFTPPYVDAAKAVDYPHYITRMLMNVPCVGSHLRDVSLSTKHMMLNAAALRWGDMDMVRRVMEVIPFPDEVALSLSSSSLLASPLPVKYFHQQRSTHQFGNFLNTEKAEDTMLDEEKKLFEKEQALGSLSTYLQSLLEKEEESEQTEGAVGGVVSVFGGQGTTYPPFVPSGGQQSITFLPSYQDWSFEELRLQDYILGNKHKYINGTVFTPFDPTTPTQGLDTVAIPFKMNAITGMAEYSKFSFEVRFMIDFVLVLF